MRDFTCGPFMSASQNIDRFAYAVYYSYLFDETLQEALALEKKLELAIQNNDDDENIKTLQTQVQAREGMLQLTLAATSGDYFEDA